jgi:quaternary ammonium compound-resistance protein SugE
MAWALVVAAGLFETAFALSLKQSETFTRLWWSISFVACAAVSFVLLSMALKTLPVGPAYAVWTGIGAAGTAIAGMISLDDPVDIVRIVAIVLVLCGVLALQLAPSAAHG